MDPHTALLILPASPFPYVAKHLDFLEEQLGWYRSFTDVCKILRPRLVIEDAKYRLAGGVEVL